MSTNLGVKMKGHETPKTSRNWLIPLYVISVIFVILFLIIPLGKIILETLGLIGGDSALPQDFFPYMFRITWNSMRLAFLTTFFSLLIAIPSAIAINKLNVPLKSLWTIFLTIPLITPPFISGFATILLWGRTGVLMRLLTYLGMPSFSVYGLPGLVMTQVLHLMPYSLLIILSGLQSVPAHLEEASHSLGSSFTHTMGRVVLPYIMPHILMGGTLVFLTSLGDVGGPLLIGGRYRVLPVEIYSNFISYLGDDRIPIVFSAWVIIMASVMMILVNYLLKKTQIKHSFKTRVISYDLPKTRVAGTVFLAVVTIIFLLPYVAIVVASFGTIWSTGLLPEAFTLDHYNVVLSNVTPIKNSMVILAGAMPLALFLAVMLGQMNKDYPKMAWLDFITMLPFVIPGVVIGVSFIRTYGAVKIFGVDVTSTFFVLMIALAIRRLPHAIRTLTAGFARIDRSLEEAAWSLGASKTKTFKDVVLPQLRPTIFAASVILTIKVITELGATLILYPPGWMTMPIYIYYYVSEGQLARGSAMGVILIIIVGIGNAISNRFSKERGAI